MDLNRAIKDGFEYLKFRKHDSKLYLRWECLLFMRTSLIFKKLIVSCLVADHILAPGNQAVYFRS